MKDIKRIPRIMYLIEKIWRHNPEWTFAQLLGEFLSWHEEASYFLDDDEVEGLLMKFYEAIGGQD